MLEHHRDGYKIYRQVLDTQKLQKIRLDAVQVFVKVINKYLHNHGGMRCPSFKSFEENLQDLYKYHPKVVSNVGKVIQNSLLLSSMYNDQMILHLIERDWAIKDAVIATKPVLFFHNKNLAKNEFYWKLPWHRDYGSCQGSLNGVVVWFPLIPKTKSVGSLEVIPGSHLTETNLLGIDYNFAMEAEVDESKAISLDLELGDMVIFSQNLVHRSGDNKDETAIRWSVNLRYSDLECKNWLERDLHHPYTYSPNTISEFYDPSPAEMKKIYE